MKKLLLLSIMLVLLVGCQKHFISDKNYRKQVHEDFLQRKELASNRSEALFNVFEQDLSCEEKEALEFLYAYMPLSDLADYDGEFFLKQVRTALKTRETFSWGDKIPEEVFRHFVLVYRVNNENLDSARMVFYEELKTRIENLSMYEAALEVNHWCHEKVAYRPSDIRTSAPLATVRTALGRCGEESTFTVTALRAVGIPARQCYTPRWAHCDDNHAWVEVWVDGKWYFLGACEPDPELNMGWFAIPSTRTMMVHSNAFGKYTGDEEVTYATNLFSRINMLSNYAEHKNIRIRVNDTQGKAVENATVQFKLYNYSEYYPIATRQTDQNGITSLTTGLGDLLIWATDGQHYNYAKMDVRLQDSLTLTLSRNEGEAYSELLTIVPPTGNSQVVTASAEKAARNSQRLQYEDSIRNAYLATFKTEADAAEIHNDNLSLEQIEMLLKKSEGNYAELIHFLNQHHQKENGFYLFELLNSLSDKDLRDFSADILKQHITRYDSTMDYPFDVYVKGIISPRIANEGLRPWRPFLQQQLHQDLGNNPSVENIKQWILQQIVIDDEGNYFNCPISPQGVYELRRADQHSRNIFFVAACRSMNIPAYMDNATGQLFAYENGDWQIVNFTQDEPTPTTGTLVIEYDQLDWLKPVYWTHFTLAKYENGDFVTFDYENDPRVEQFPITLELEAGYYLLSTGNRYTDGTALSRLEFFTIKADSITHKNLTIRNLDEETVDYGKIDLQYSIPDKDKNIKVYDLQKDREMLICFIDPTREPTKHLLKDIAAHAQEFEKRDCQIVFVVADGKYAPDFNFDAWKLPKQSSLFVDNGGLWLKNALSTIKSNFKNDFPLVLLINNQGEVIYKSEGYHIGTASQILLTR